MLERIESPQDLRGLSHEELHDLAEEIRDVLVESVSRTGGHLGPNLGVVELTLALHRVFDSPRDRLVFDTGHQSYVHKLVTGRRDFSGLRQRGGLSGYPSRAESEHDVVENSHASTAISWAAGIARGHALRGEDDRTTVAVIGDGALTGGMAWEALNSLADSEDRVVIVMNDNGRSYAPTIGGLARKLDGIRVDPRYEQFLGWGKRTFENRGRLRTFLYHTVMHGKRALKGLMTDQGLFEDLGLKYIGPIDGHSQNDLETALRQARDYGAPVLVHVLTQKGRGYEPAEQDDADRFHAVGRIHPETGLPIEQSRFGWTKVFADEMLKAGREREDIVALTAAMLAPVGLQPFAEEFPERVIDVGIAEQHAVTSAAGLAFAGMHPVVAVYATFLNRAFDQVLMDVALHKAGVTFMLDRAGITGDDGASHNGMWDMALLRHVPGLRLAAPRDEATLRTAFREALDVDDAPTVVRYPKGAIGDDIPALRQVGDLDVLAELGEGPAEVVVLGVGAMAPTAIEVAGKLAAEGRSVMAATATWVRPVPEGLLETLGDAELVVTVEDGLTDAGVGQEWAEFARLAGRTARWSHHGIPREFLDHASRAQIVERVGLDASAIAEKAEALLS
ncbi:1-deoxy-D-xylulose-5-phosphate synthase [Demequina zhanjiangensis]|uniref:1-deoxy-D-xylulose-5-phosphate synthase n=1 Tax=Demequina zhanjiangensis TaxID=3051659 RepID=A0ABT8G0W1_9MICO|nr:1-deoxy-D-xylulose-5-phosphate synthase [Demequina sp. SYSU T00b26]MDN4472728.1 1-deoxy-D-xylulose-5-phosphate synthase [Demequina sp. SYSU T00b26]